MGGGKRSICSPQAAPMIIRHVINLKLVQSISKLAAPCLDIMIQIVSNVILRKGREQLLKMREIDAFSIEMPKFDSIS